MDSYLRLGMFDMMYHLISYMYYIYKEYMLKIMPTLLVYITDHRIYHCFGYLLIGLIDSQHLH